MKSNSSRGLAVTLVVLQAACGGQGKNPVAPAAANNPPTVVRVEVVGYTIAGFGAQLPVRAEVRDPDGEAVTCRWTSESGRVLVDSANTCNGVYSAPAGGATDRLEVVPTDARGLSGSAGSTTVVLGPNSVPVGQPPPPTPEPSTRPDPGP